MIAFVNMMNAEIDFKIAYTSIKRGELSKKVKPNHLRLLTSLLKMRTEKSQIIPRLHRDA